MVTTRRQTGAAEAVDYNIDVFYRRALRSTLSTSEVLRKQPAIQAVKNAAVMKATGIAKTTQPSTKTARATPAKKIEAGRKLQPLKISLPAKNALPAKTVVQKRRKQLSRAPKIGNHVLFLFVGPLRELVTIHTDLIPAATQDHIHEVSAGQQLYELPEQDPEIFRIYRGYLYTKRIYSVDVGDRNGPDSNDLEAYSDAEWTRLAHLYLLGITLKDERFANTIITCIIEKMGEADRYPTGIASVVYACTPAGDGLRKLIVDVHVWKGHGTWISEPHDDADAPKDFLTDVIAALAEAGGQIHKEGALMPWEGKGRQCMRYHTHEGTAKCEA
ncbi:hypothetical protein LTR37_016921 [Vermiconidia calcicola]|uniref:Uncharacterized protein n=1 Tax=Vermiconidia calcicola TaxID=1690605 RepID=A0ACC3MM40_9PEZI|nr:hypothetical protein LTR37_016921 [Vermiconidia calcicola]